MRNNIKLLRSKIKYKLIKIPYYSKRIYGIFVHNSNILRAFWNYCELNDIWKLNSTGFAKYAIINS